MIKALLTALLAFGLAVPAFANMEMGGHREGHGPMMEMCAMCNMDDTGGMMGNCLVHAARVGLTEEQIAKIRPIHLEMEKKQVRFRADLKLARIDLREIMAVKDFDLEKASAQVRRIEELKTAHHLDMLKLMKQVHSILTEEQFRKMKSMAHGEMPGMKHKQPKRMMEKM